MARSSSSSGGYGWDDPEYDPGQEFDPYANYGFDPTPNPPKQDPSTLDPFGNTKPYNPTDPHPLYSYNGETPGPYDPILAAPSEKLSAGPVDTRVGPGTSTATQYGGVVDAYTGPYADIPGYDYGKLSDPTHRGPGKYNSDVALFSQALAATGAQPGDAGMQAVLQWLNAHGANATVQGDQLKFGDYSSPIDVMTNYNPTGEGTSWSFQDPRGQAQPAGGAGGDITQGFNVNGLGGSGDAGWMTSGLQQLFQKAMETIGNPVGSAQFEALRQPIDKARLVQTNSAAAALADRGILSGSGELANAQGRIESQLAPDFATAVQNASVANTKDAEQTALGALQGGTNLTQVQGNLTLGLLDQNRQWNQFIADFGLQREQVANMIQSGHIDQLLHYFEIWVGANQITSNGQVK